MPGRSFALVGCLLSLACPSRYGETAAQEFVFEDVIYLDGDNVSYETTVEGINDAGTLVGTFGENIDIRNPVHLNTKGYIRIDDEWEILEPFGSNAISATSINNQGIVVGNYLSGDNLVRGFVYDSGEFYDIFPAGMTSPSGAPAVDALLADIDEDGVLIGTFSTDGSLSGFGDNDLYGFRGTPDPNGGPHTYTWGNPVQFPGATGTFLNSRNNHGVEVGSALIQTIFGNELFGYVLPDQRFDYPDEVALGTQFMAVNDAGAILGGTTLLDLDLNIGSFVIRHRSFLLDLDDFESPDPPVPQDIMLPGPDCGVLIDEFGNQEEACRSIATNMNNLGEIVGFYDNNDGILRGFVGRPALNLVPGDFNQDGVVDSGDLSDPNTGWIARFGVDLDGGDFLIWQRQYGTIAAAQSTAIPLPESSSLLLFTLAWIATLLSRHRS